MYNYYDKTKTIQLTRGDTVQMGFNFTVVVGSTAVTDYKAVWHLKKKTPVCGIRSWPRRRSRTGCSALPMR